MEYSHFQSIKAQSTRGVDYATSLGMTTTSALSSVSSAGDMLKDAGDTADTQLTNAIKLTGIESSSSVQKIQNQYSVEIVANQNGEEIPELTIRTDS